MLLLVALAALVIAEAGAASELAWLGAATAALLLATGMARRSPAARPWGGGLLGAIFLLRHDTRLLLAPPYGAGLLLMDDLAIPDDGAERDRPDRPRGDRRSRRRRRWRRGDRRLRVRRRGARGHGRAAPVGPLTAVGALAAVAAFVAIVRLARRRFGPSDAEPRLPPPGPAPQAPRSHDAAA